MNGGVHLFQIIEAIKNTKHVHALGRRVVDAFNDHVVRVGSVPDGIGPPNQHLQTYIGAGRTNQPQTFPRVFGQKSMGDIKRRTTPHFKRKGIVQHRAGFGHRGQQVTRTHSGGQQRLVSVPQRRVRDQSPRFGLFTHPQGQCFGPVPVQNGFGVDTGGGGVLLGVKGRQIRHVLGNVGAFAFQGGIFPFQCPG